jgi:hypothetical protein
LPALKKKPAKNARKQRASEALGQAIGKIRGLESQVSEMIREMQEKVAQLETLNEVSQLLNSSLDVGIVPESGSAWAP